MCSEIYEFDGFFFNDPFLSIDILQAFQEHKYNYTPLLPSPPSNNTQENIDTTFDEIDQITPRILSTSPPTSHHLENLSLFHMGISVTSSNEVLDFGSLEVKTEESQLPVYDNYYYGSSSFQFMEEANFKVGRYNAKERKEKILKYRAKRTQRNFNKTIKYACRKTLADRRPRVRGRFARNDEPGENPKTTTFYRYGDEDDILMDGFHDEDYGRGQYFNIYQPIGQFQKFSFIHN